MGKDKLITEMSFNFCINKKLSREKSVEQSSFKFYYILIYINYLSIIYYKIEKERLKDKHKRIKYYFQGRCRIFFKNKIHSSENKF